MLEQLSKIYIGFGDVIYALIVASSFEFLREHLIPFQLTFETFTIFLAYATIVQSWIGYHKTIEMHSYKTSFRFVLDLIIWFLMFSLLYTADDFNEYIKIFPFIFLFLMLWRYGVIRDDYLREGRLQTLHALGIVLIYVITSSVTVIVHYILLTNNLVPSNILNFVVLGIMYCEVFLYYQLRKKDRISNILTKKPKDQKDSNSSSK